MGLLVRCQSFYERLASLQDPDQRRNATEFCRALFQVLLQEARRRVLLLPEMYLMTFWTQWVIQTRGLSRVRQLLSCLVALLELSTQRSLGGLPLVECRLLGVSVHR